MLREPVRVREQESFDGRLARREVRKERELSAPGEREEVARRDVEVLLHARGDLGEPVALGDGDPDRRRRRGTAVEDVEGVVERHVRREVVRPGFEGLVAASENELRHDAGATDHAALVQE